MLLILFPLLSPFAADAALDLKARQDGRPLYHFRFQPAEISVESTMYSGKVRKSDCPKPAERLESQAAALCRTLSTYPRAKPGKADVVVDCGDSSYTVPANAPIVRSLDRLVPGFIQLKTAPPSVCKK